MDKLTAIAAGAACAFAIATPASAAIIIKASPGFVQPDENVLADTSMTGTTVMGTTNQSNTAVSLQSSEALTSTESNGQSRFVATDGSLSDGNIFLTSGGTFTSAEFNLFSALSGTTSVAVTVNGVTQSFNIGNGQNFIGIEATDGDTISSIQFATNGTGVTDLRQLRVGGVQSPVPEPASWALMLFGFGALGFAMRRRQVTHTPQLA